MKPNECRKQIEKAVGALAVARMSLEKAAAHIRPMPDVYMTGPHGHINHSEIAHELMEAAADIPSIIDVLMDEHAHT